MTQSTWDVIRAHIARRLSEVAEQTVDPKDLVVPPSSEHGDLAFGCFALGKVMGANPADVAVALAQKLEGTDVTIAAATPVGPYLNFRIHVGALVPRLLAEVAREGEAFGQTDALAGQKTLFEYANPNTHKEIHVGHLRNLILGASLVPLLRRAGATVIPVSYINDIGTHVAKCLWKLVTDHGYDVRVFAKDDVDALLNAVPGEDRNARYLGDVYTQATRALEEEDALQENVSFVHAALEKHEPAWEALWRETKRWCMDEINGVFDELGVRIERQYFDSECVDRAHELLQELEEKKIAIKSQGALIIDMEEQKLGVMLLRKSDGSLLYAAKDLALAELKAQEYPDFTQSVVLVDMRQALNFRQLAEALKRMGYAQSFGFLGYELVTLPEGAMSSRKGNIVTFFTFRDAVMAASRASTIERHPDWSEGKVAHISWCLAIAGMKFAMLKQDPNKRIVFDIQKALSFDGDTGPYVLYAATRLNSILKKAGWTDGFDHTIDADGLVHDTERALALRIAAFPDVVRRAAVETKPSALAQWCLSLAQEVNAFYRDVPVLDAPTDVRAARLALAALARHALVHGSELLGIPVPDEM